MWFLEMRLSSRFSLLSRKKQIRLTILIIVIRTRYSRKLWQMLIINNWRFFLKYFRSSEGGWRAGRAFFQRKLILADSKKLEMLSSMNLIKPRFMIDFSEKFLHWVNMTSGFAKTFDVLQMWNVPQQPRALFHLYDSAQKNVNMLWLIFLPPTHFTYSRPVKMPLHLSHITTRRYIYKLL